MNVYILNGTVLIQIKKIWLSQEGYIEIKLWSNIYYAVIHQNNKT